MDYGMFQIQVLASRSVVMAPHGYGKSKTLTELMISLSMGRAIKEQLPILTAY